jgi:hypothetical protein
LAEGDDYTVLRPTISICFLNAVLFPERPEYHTQFRLLDPTGKVCLTADLVIHVIEIPKFNRTLAELRTPLDFWLYFLKNGRGLDADALPGELDRRSEVRKAMGVLKMLAQNDMERELYEGRLKAKRDLQTLETQRRTLETERQTLETQGRTLEMQRRAMEAERDHWQERYEAATREREQATREREQATREREQATRREEQARREVHRELAERVRLCQRLLRRPVSEADELLGESVEALRELAESLERDLTR